jgi:Cu/Ag efflux pump CusA
MGSRVCLLTDMLEPPAVAVIGVLCMSVLLSLVVTPTVYCLMKRMTSSA